MTNRATDAIHFGLMLSALVITYLVPFELSCCCPMSRSVQLTISPKSRGCTIGSISFPHRSVPMGLAILAVIAALIDNASWFGFIIWMALRGGAARGRTTALQGTALVIVAIWLTAVLAMNGSSLAVLGILLPTLIHVSLFTLVFMVLGAIRSGSKTQALLIALYLLAIVILLAAPPPSASTQIPAFAKAAQDYFGNVGAGARTAARDREPEPRYPPDRPAAPSSTPTTT